MVTAHVQLEGGFLDLIRITFLSWNKWNPRKDIKRPTWFALSNRITEDDDMLTLSDAEFRAFIHMFCLASQKNEPFAILNFEKAERVTGIKKMTFIRAVERLAGIGICVSESVGSPSDDVQMPDGSRQNTSSTLPYTTLHDPTLIAPPPAASKKGIKKTKAIAVSAEPSTATLVWQAYSQGYEKLYGALPVRNARVNGQIAQFVKRVAKEEAPGIAAFFVTHPNSFYVSRMHDFGLCLGNAEQLRTQWAKNTPVTDRMLKEYRAKSTEPALKSIGELLAERDSHEDSNAPLIEE